MKLVFSVTSGGASFMAFENEVSYEQYKRKLQREKNKALVRRLAVKRILKTLFEN